MTMDKLLDKKILKLTVFDWIVILCTCVLGVAIRVLFIEASFPDYTVCLKPWVEAFKEYGGFGGLKYEIGNYTPSYMHILMLISYFDVEPLYLIKLCSIVMDIVLSIVLALLLGHGKSKQIKILLFSIVMIIPTLIVNSGVWGQCDNFYTTFSMLALLVSVSGYTIKLGKNRSFELKEDDLCMILVGMAFSFKLQTIFLLPVYAVFFILKKYRLQCILWIPFVYFLTLIPSLIAGRPLGNLLTIYFRQTQDFSELNLNFPNVYSFWQFDGLQRELSWACTLFCVLIIMIVLYYIYLKKPVLDVGFICSLGTFSVFVMTYFLPHMHERYAYMGELLSLHYLVENKKMLYFPVISVLMTLSSYATVLLWFDFGPLPLFISLIRIVLILISGYDIVRRCNHISGKADYEK